MSPPRRSLRSRAIRASFWRIGVYASNKVLRVLSNVVLAGLLSPAAFGLVALSDIIIRGLNMFSEIGIGPAIVQSRRGDDRTFLNTAWTMQVVRGFVLLLGALALALPMAHLYEEPRLRLILPVAALGVLIAGFQSTSWFTLNRKLAEGRRATLEFVRALVTRGTMVAIALIWPDVWALIIGTLLGTLIFTIATHRLIPGLRNRFAWDRDCAREIIHFGGWIFIGTVIAFFSQQADRLLLGKIETLSAVDAISVLGVYSQALAIAVLPKEFANMLGQNVLFPVLSEMVRQDPHRFAERVRRVRAVVLNLGVVTTLGVVAGAPIFFEVLYDSRYHDATWIAPLAVITSWIALLNATPNKALLSLALTRPLALAGLIRLIATVSACLLGLHIGRGLGYPLGGFILGTSVGVLIPHLYETFVLQRRGISLISQDVRYTISLALASACVIAGDRLVAPHGSDVSSVAMRVLVVGGIAGVFCLLPLRAVMREFRR